jgi:hypothetical protein
LLFKEEKPDTPDTTPPIPKGKANNGNVLLDSEKRINTETVKIYEVVLYEITSLGTFS